MHILDFLDQERYPKPLKAEPCELLAANGRVLAENIYAKRNIPSFSESTRDGFALSSIIKQETYRLRTEEAFAGNTDTIKLQDGEACPIMTGGLIPENCQFVIPHEHTEIADNSLIVNNLNLPNFIRYEGSEYKTGDLLYPKGTILRAEHISMLGSTGNNSPLVYKKPRLAFLATGEELCPLGVEPLPGKKTATNCYFFMEMCEKYGAEFHDLGLVNDNKGDIKKALQKNADKFDIIVTTGGMGPGKYDLLEECFQEVDGRKVTNKLPMVPGKSTLIGWLNDCLFYGLPGTPAAIRPLFTVLIARSLISMQGISEENFPDFKAKMMETFSVRKNPINSLWPAKTIIQNSELLLKGIKKGEYPDGYIAIDANVDKLQQGEEYYFYSLRSPLS